MNKELMKTEIETLALKIIQDLGISEHTVDFGYCWRLCQEHGCEPIVVSGLQQNHGMYIETVQNLAGEGNILLSSELTLEKACAVIIHELVHRLTMGPRYESYNIPYFEQYPRREWLEMLALEVERLFIETGGTGPRGINNRKL